MLCCAVVLQVRDREGAQQDLTSHCLAYKRRELQSMLGGSSLFASSSSSSSANNSSSSSSSGSSSSSTAEQSQSQQPGEQEQQQQQPQQPEPQQPEQQQPQRRAFGMLLFSCNGRGMNLYNEPSWDSRTLASYIPVPVSGFMCNGGLGLLGSILSRRSQACRHLWLPQSLIGGWAGQKAGQEVGGVGHAWRCWSVWR
jgi:hypothetical protein